jgi:hypothetical protein
MIEKTRVQTQPHLANARPTNFAAHRPPATIPVAAIPASLIALFVAIGGISFAGVASATSAKNSCIATSQTANECTFACTAGSVVEIFVTGTSNVAGRADCANFSSPPVSCASTAAECHGLGTTWPGVSPTGTCHLDAGDAAGCRSCPVQGHVTDLQACIT